ncbi:hypothetical protein ED733_003192 [Metarhizium rileyi]|uniref:Uncharacterized protein n=1 Tax=Metarhizium rileyi (strain RCEF 4871) TaxID=1649241 RepID=A0A5C6GKW5_METRR|nr:hypothetical protein ED733_003192 [Metarhizium rileyi]
MALHRRPVTIREAQRVLDLHLVMDGVQRNIQVLISTVQKQRYQSTGGHEAAAASYAAPVLGHWSDAVLENLDGQRSVGFTATTEKKELWYAATWYV